MQSLLYKLPGDLTNEQRMQVDHLLHEYDVILYDMGRTTLVEHAVDTVNHGPI